MNIETRLKILEKKVETLITKEITVSRNRFYLGPERKFYTNSEEEYPELSVEELRKLSKSYKLKFSGWVDDEGAKLLKSLRDANYEQVKFPSANPLSLEEMLEEIHKLFAKNSDKEEDAEYVENWEDWDDDED